MAKVLNVRLLPGLLFFGSASESVKTNEIREARWFMGRGDRRTRKGKIFRHSYGKSRPKPEKIRRLKELRKSEESEEPEDPISVPEPPVKEATPPKYPPVVDGVIWDLSDEPFQELHYTRN